jgi:hypothetical protein
MESNDQGLNSFIQLTKPILERVFGAGKISELDLSVIYGQAKTCIFSEEKFCIHTRINPRHDRTDFIMMFEGFQPAEGWKIMDEKVLRNLSLERAAYICGRFN